MSRGLELKLARTVKELIDNVGRPRVAAIFQEYSLSFSKVKNHILIVHFSHYELRKNSVLPKSSHNYESSYCLQNAQLVKQISINQKCYKPKLVRANNMNPPCFWLHLDPFHFNT